MPGRLILCASPIGNLADAPPRLRSTLEKVDLVYAEDTRRASILLRSLGLDRPTRSYFAGNEEERSQELEVSLRDGGTVALLTDAGTPAISDPGLSAVRAARRAGATVSIVPGPSAVTAALAVSGLPTERFVFEGFLPRRGEERRRRLRVLATEPRTVVLFTSPHRAVEDLAELVETCGGDRPVCVTRELTKVHEEVWWGTLGEAAARWAAEPPRGEVTIVIGGVEPPPPDLAAAVAAVERLVDAGSSPSAAVRRVAEETGTSRRELYEAVVRSR